MVKERVLIIWKYFSDGPPYKMRLILDGDALANQWTRQGIYLLGEGSKVNGYDHWYQRDGANGIWQSIFSPRWIVGDIGSLGQYSGGIFGPLMLVEVKWPTQITVGWSHEVVFIECKYL